MYFLKLSFVFVASGPEQKVTVT